MVPMPQLSSSVLSGIEHHADGCYLHFADTSVMSIIHGRDGLTVYYCAAGGKGEYSQCGWWKPPDLGFEEEYLRWHHEQAKRIAGI